MYFTQAVAVAILAYTAAAAPAGPTCVSRDSVCRKYTANNGLSVAQCDVSIAQCIGACQVSFTACQTAPDANHSQCASQLVACTGTSYTDALKPQSAVGEAVTQPAPTSSAGTPVYQGNCEQLDTICRTAPGANMAQCSAEQAQCKDTCSKEANACRVAPGANMAQCSAEQAQCKDTCSKEANACRVVPGANQSLCSANYAACLGENPYA